MFNKDFFLVRIPFLKDYNFFDRKNGVEAQRVIFHKNLTKLYNGEIIKFKQFNVSSEFIFYAQRIDDRTFYHFIIKNKFYPQLEDGQLDELEKKVFMLAINQIDNKLSYSGEIMVKDNQSIDENKLDEIFNNINGILFKVEEETEENDTPLFENKIMGGKADKMSVKDIANKFKVSVNKIQAQIKKGIKIEMEHTGDKEKAIEIAMDHLTEFPDYYDRLEKMETTAKKEFKNITESQKMLIKKLLREELEEGGLARTLGTLGMAASTLASPNINAINKNPQKIEKSEKIGITQNSDGTITSIAKTDGPTKEMAKDLAINKAKVQIAAKLNLDSDEFDYEVVDFKFDKGKNNVICTVRIVARIK